jgi:hypothetical protein
MRFQFIDEHRHEFPVTRMCQVLSVSPSGYYVWRQRPVSAREMANQQLVEKGQSQVNAETIRWHLRKLEYSVIRPVLSINSPDPDYTAWAEYLAAC